MRAARSFLLMIAALLALLATPAALAAAQPQAPVAASEPCSSPCADMHGNCGGDGIRCDAAMAGCMANASCGMPVAVGPGASVSPKGERAGSPDVQPQSAALHGRSIKPEIHPPSVLDQQA